MGVKYIYREEYEDGGRGTSPYTQLLDREQLRERLAARYSDFPVDEQERRIREVLDELGRYGSASRNFEEEILDSEEFTGEEIAVDVEYDAHPDLNNLEITAVQGADSPRRSRSRKLNLRRLTEVPE